MTLKLKDFGLSVGNLEPGPNNCLTDISGVEIGHVTLSNGKIQTGVTAILPAGGNLFEHKCVAASHVINGFGKSVGLMQVDELGQLETPIILTNTFAVGTASTALVRYMLTGNQTIGETTGSVNPLVMECNDGAYLNDIRGLHVTEQHVASALGSTSPDCRKQGAVGAGTGMSAYGLKGGIGTASRRIELGESSHLLGAFTLCNMGLLADLRIANRATGPEIERILERDRQLSMDEKGSVIILLATDAPLSSRQLGRIARRAGAGLARTGTQFGSGSGDIVLAYSTANRIPHSCPESAVLDRRILHEDKLDMFFRAAIEATEEAILNALFNAHTVTGKHGRISHGLADFWRKLC